jgi:hypothetical protein
MIGQIIDGGCGGVVQTIVHLLGLHFVIQAHSVLQFVF